MVANAELLTSIRTSLADERESLMRQLDGIGVTARDANLDANFADSGQVAAEVGEARALAGSLMEQLAAVDEALARLEAGTYGTCQRCGQPIAEARLEAMPAARLCMACAARH